MQFFCRVNTTIVSIENTKYGNSIVFTLFKIYIINDYYLCFNEKSPEIKKNSGT